MPFAASGALFAVAPQELLLARVEREDARAGAAVSQKGAESVDHDGRA